MAAGCSTGLGEVLDGFLASLGGPDGPVVAGLIEDPNLWDPNLCDPNNCEPGPCDPNHYDPAFYDPNFYDPNFYDPNFYDPGDYDPNFYDPNDYDPAFYDPNFYDPNYYDPGDYDPNLYDPNDYDPNYFPQAPRTLSGTWESLPNDDAVGAWDDPECALAQIMGQDHPFGDMGTIDPNVREFMVFDANDTVVATYVYESGLNTVQVSGPGDDPLIGQTFEDLGDGSLGVMDFVMMQGAMAGWMYATMSTDIVAWPSAEDESWRIEITFRAHIQVTESESLPPGLEVGDEAVYTLERSLTFVPSPSPAELFPDAAWEMAVDEDAVNGSVPTGYVEVIGPTGQDSVGWAPGSHETLVQLMDDPNTLPGSMFNENSRGFALYDSEGRMITNYDYSDDPEEIVTIGSLTDNPMAGILPVRGDHCWTWTASLTFGSSPIQVSFNAQIIMGDGNLSEGRYVAYLLQMTYQVVNQDWESPLGTIPRGSTATYSIVQEGQMVASEGPYALFPDAQFVMEPSEE